MAKILLVEDEKDIREVYFDILTSAGHNVQTAEDGNTALQKMQEGGWDIVLLDIMLPQMNGIDIMNALHEHPPVTPNKAVVFLTNIDQGDEIKKALSLGSGYIMKSQISPGDLTELVNVYLKQQTSQEHQN